MKIKAEIYKVIENGSSLKGIAGITLDDVFEVKNVRIIQNGQKPFVVMPSRQNINGGFDDICKPLTAELKTEINKAVLAAYDESRAAAQRGGNAASAQE